MLVAFFFSLLPIGAVILGVCLGAGMLLIAAPLSDLHYLQAAINFLILTLIMSWLLTPLAYRFFARAFPLKASGEPNYSAKRTLHISLTIMTLICVGFTLLCWDCISAMTRHGMDLVSAFGAAMAAISLTFFAIMLLCAFSLTYGLVRILAAHRRPTVWASQPYVLFLRSFGSVSDSAALGSLVKGAGGRARVAFLSSPQSVKASWNPLTLTTVGFSFRYPFRSAPVFLESTDERWEEDVRRMADSAHVVVIDTTHHSPGLSHEIDLLAEPALSGKTVRFEELVRDDAADGRARTEGVILLERSPVLRRWSQLLGFIFMYLGFVGLTGILVSIFDFNWSSTPTKIILRSSLLYSVVPAIWGAAKLSPAAGFTRRSARALVEAMKQKIGGFPAPARATRAIVDL